MKNIAILGGTFDPIHIGHIAIAEAAAAELSFDKIVLIPTGDPPHKQCFASAANRFHMATLAANAVNNIFASDVETARAGMTYTVDTIKSMKTLEPDGAFYYIIGGDTLLLLETWRSFSEVARMLNGFVIAIRPGTDETVMRVEMERLSQKYALSMILLRVHGPDVSSTTIRLNIITGRPYASLVASGVKDYIEENGLYLTPVRESLARELNYERYEHVLSVEAAAVRLARRFGADVSTARLAALLHDCAKNLTIQEMRELVSRASIPVDDEELENRQLLHAPAGAALARDKYGVENSEILSAIRWHTVGRREMTTLEKIIYVADAIELNRRDLNGLHEIRELSKVDLNQVVLKIAMRKNRYIVNRGFVSSRHTLELIEKATLNTKNVEEKQ